MNMIRALVSALVMLLALSPVTCAEVVINELFYHAADNVPDLEWIELHNTDDEPVDVSGWSFNRGIKFIFPRETWIAPNDYIVLCKNNKLFDEFYDVETKGEFTGGLSNRGETVELADANRTVIDSVTPSGPGQLLNVLHGNRLGIGGRLSLALGVVVGFTLVATAVTWVLFDDVTQNLGIFTDESMPVTASSFRLSE